jgi:hypothetical protein
MTITAAATRTVLMLRLTITLSSLPLSYIPSRAAHQGTLPAKAPSATVRQPVRLCVPSNRSMSPIIARCSDRFEFRSSKPRAQRRCYRRVGEEGAWLPGWGRTCAGRRRGRSLRTRQERSGYHRTAGRAPPPATTPMNTSGVERVSFKMIRELTFCRRTG